MYRVMLAEDEELLLKAIMATIDWEAHGFSLSAAAGDGEEAYSCILRNRPDLVITDIRMPLLDGLSLIRKVGEVLSRDERPLFIILTAHGDFDYARQAVKLDAVDFLLKPLDDDELRASLDKAAAMLTERAKRLRLEVTAGMDDAFRAFSPAPPSGSGDPADVYVERTIEQIGERYVSDLSVEEIAAWLGISSGYLSRIFRKKTGYTFYDYLAFVRIRRAVEFLHDPTVRIGEVADRVGYSDQRYFSQRFKKIVGCTPSEYREGKAH